MTQNSYLLDNAVSEAGDRFRAFAEIFDPCTFRHMLDLGLARGWRCWEVGAGGSSVIQWLSERVGSSGRVLGTDIDLSWVQTVAGGNVDLRRHDVARDERPEGTFDLVHARLVLVHLPDRDRALRSMYESLRPGGWLLVEDADPALQPLSCVDVHGANQELANRIRMGFRALLSQRGADLQYGRKLPRAFRELGLIDVSADGYFPVALRACIPLEIATIKLIRRDLISQGIASSEEIDRHLANVVAGRLDLAQPPIISAWGRRPEPAGCI
jgi:SAM-dependent methyltransferase